MTSFLNPAPFDSNENKNDNLIEKKRISHNRTQKRHVKEPFLTEKVSKLLESIHENDEKEDNNEDDGTNLADFNPPPPPNSVGAERRANTDSKREAMQNLGSFSVAAQNEYISSLGKQPLPMDETDDYDVNNFSKNYGDSQTTNDFYKKYVPNYSNANATINFGSRPYKQDESQKKPQQVLLQGNNHDILISKLNYMIHLLEEKQDERTNNVTEEVVLYSFLGIFIIFIVDSFSRIGKYVR
jgi:hypothetical protein